MLAPKARAVAFFTASVAAAVGLYVVGAPQQNMRTSGAIAAEGPPIVRADSSQSAAARVAAVDVSAAMKPVMAPAMPRDKATLIRQLQSALARAGCYGGDVSGVWTDASRDAMQSFVVAVNAQLPVLNPDTTLLSLVASNTGASCARTAALTTGTLPSEVSRPVAEPKNSESERGSPSISITDSAEAAEPKSSMLEFAWARSDMLAAPKESEPPLVIKNEVSPPRVEALIVGSSEPASEGEAPPPKSETAPAVSEEPASPVARETKRQVALKAEPDDTAGDDKIYRKAAVQEPAEADADTNKDDAASQPSASSKSERSKPSKSAKNSAKKRPTTLAKQGPPKSLSKSLDSLARTVSSLFD